MNFSIPKYFTMKDFKKVGIYFLIKQGRVVYVGQTCSLINRLSSHEFRNESDKIRFIECSLDMLDHYEKRWIIKFRPKYNRQHLFKTVGGWKTGYKTYEINLRPS